MQEKTIEIKGINPVELYGVHDEKLKMLQSYFPKLKIVPRGSQLIIMGDEEQMSAFEKKLNLCLAHLLKYNHLTEGNIENLMTEGGAQLLESKAESHEILVYGTRGLQIKARTVHQREMVEKIGENDMIFAIGPAGTGKTYTAVALAVRALKNKEVRKIILTRPAVEAGENIGFLPGDLKEKLDPYLQPLYDALHDMIPPEKLDEYFEAGIIQIAPLGFMRGRTLDNAFVILDEAQNATEAQLKMFLTRMGKSAKFIITGDRTQIDLPHHQKSGLIKACQILDGVEDIAFIYLDDKDVIRHKIVKSIIHAFKMDNQDSSPKNDQEND